ncbi:centromere protein C [Bombina bombina]|uniref:centromere protein C n=1 Tax=Bombina bombina TaxID=8345 RepID=UPI00235AA2C4|nr:centromere protein C [Bombina bombina]
MKKHGLAGLDRFKNKYRSRYCNAAGLPEIPDLAPGQNVMSAIHDYFKDTSGGIEENTSNQVSWSTPVSETSSKLSAPQSNQKLAPSPHFRTVPPGFQITSTPHIPKSKEVLHSTGHHHKSKAFHDGVKSTLNKTNKNSLEPEYAKEGADITSDSKQNNGEFIKINAIFAEVEKEITSTSSLGRNIAEPMFQNFTNENPTTKKRFSEAILNPSCTALVAPSGQQPEEEEFVIDEADSFILKSWISNPPKKKAPSVGSGTKNDTYQSDADKKKYILGGKDALASECSSLEHALPKASSNKEITVQPKKRQSNAFVMKNQQEAVLHSSTLQDGHILDQAAVNLFSLSSKKDKKSDEAKIYIKSPHRGQHAKKEFALNSPKDKFLNSASKQSLSSESKNISNLPQKSLKALLHRADVQDALPSTSVGNKTSKQLILLHKSGKDDVILASNIDEEDNVDVVSGAAILFVEEVKDNITDTQAKPPERTYILDNSAVQEPASPTIKLPTKKRLSFRDTPLKGKTTVELNKLGEISKREELRRTAEKKKQFEDVIPFTESKYVKSHLQKTASKGHSEYSAQPSASLSGKTDNETGLLKKNMEIGNLTSIQFSKQLKKQNNSEVKRPLSSLFLQAATTGHAVSSLVSDVKLDLPAPVASLPPAQHAIEDDEFIIDEADSLILKSWISIPKKEKPPSKVPVSKTEKSHSDTGMKKIDHESNRSGAGICNDNDQQKNDIEIANDYEKLVNQPVPDGSPPKVANVLKSSKKDFNLRKKTPSIETVSKKDRGIRTAKKNVIVPKKTPLIKQLDLPDENADEHRSEEDVNAATSPIRDAALRNEVTSQTKVSTRDSNNINPIKTPVKLRNPQLEQPETEREYIEEVNQSKQALPKTSLKKAGLKEKDTSQRVKSKPAVKKKGHKKARTRSKILQSPLSPYNNCNIQNVVSPNAQSEENIVSGEENKSKQTRFKGRNSRKDIPLEQEFSSTPVDKSRKSVNMHTTFSPGKQNASKGKMDKQKMQGDIMPNTKQLKPFHTEDSLGLQTPSMEGRFHDAAVKTGSRSQRIQKPPSSWWMVSPTTINTTFSIENKLPQKQSKRNSKWHKKEARSKHVSKMKKGKTKNLKTASELQASQATNITETIKNTTLSDDPDPPVNTDSSAITKATLSELPDSQAIKDNVTERKLPANKQTKINKHKDKSAVTKQRQRRAIVSENSSTEETPALTIMKQITLSGHKKEERSKHVSKMKKEKTKNLKNTTSSELQASQATNITETIKNTTWSDDPDPPVNTDSSAITKATLSDLPDSKAIKDNDTERKLPANKQTKINKHKDKSAVTKQRQRRAIVSDDFNEEETPTTATTVQVFAPEIQTRKRKVPEEADSQNSEMPPVPKIAKSILKRRSENLEKPLHTEKTNLNSTEESEADRSADDFCKLPKKRISRISTLRSSLKPNNCGENVPKFRGSLASFGAAYHITPHAEKTSPEKLIENDSPFQTNCDIALKPPIQSPQKNVQSESPTRTENMEVEVSSSENSTEQPALSFKNQETPTKNGIINSSTESNSCEANNSSECEVLVNNRSSYLRSGSGPAVSRAVRFTRADDKPLAYDHYESSASDIEPMEDAEQKSTLKRKIVLPSNTPNVRRSKRTKVKPLEYWRGERVEYKVRQSGGLVVEGILAPVNEDPARKAVSKRKDVHKVEKVPNFEHNTEDIEPTTVLHSLNGTEILVECVKTTEHCHFNESSEIYVCKSLNQPTFSTGKLSIGPLQEKGYQFVCLDTMVFYIIQGSLEVTIYHTRYTLKSGDHFFIPPGNMYNIKNLLRKEAILLFTQIKGKRLEDDDD